MDHVGVTMRFGIGAGRRLDNLIPTPRTQQQPWRQQWVTTGVGRVYMLDDACFHEVTVYTPRAQSGGGGCNANAFCERLTVPVTPLP